MDFNTFCRSHKTTYDEKDALTWHLAQIRARKIYEQLRPQPRWPRKVQAP